MEHLAIMRKSWGLTKKILSGNKTIESRWYKNKYPPFDKIKAGDTVYFKDSGEPVKIKAEVVKVLRFSDLNHQKVREILGKFGRNDGLGIDEIEKYFQMFKDKKYCVLVFFQNPVEIEPFKINKKGYGMMSSWICLDSINKIKVS
jgi:ASC-1-like (ASCH) protein